MKNEANKERGCSNVPGLGLLHRDLLTLVNQNWWFVSRRIEKTFKEKEMELRRLF